MWKKLIKGILGLLGIIRKEKRWTTENNADFMANREPGEVILVGPGNAALSQGIAAAEDGFWSHALIHVGKAWADKMRQKYPELLKNPKINSEACDYEIIEAEGTGVQIDTLNKYSGAQLVGYSRRLSEDQLEQLFLWLYQQVGKPYGFLTFVTEIFPRPSDIPVNDPGWICSGLCATDYKQQLGIDIVNPKTNPPQGDPEDIYNWLEPLLLWGRHFLNCTIGT